MRCVGSSEWTFTVMKPVPTLGLENVTETQCSPARSHFAGNWYWRLLNNKFCKEQTLRICPDKLHLHLQSYMMSFVQAISIFRTVMTNYPCSYHCGGLVNCRNLFGLACLKWHFYYQLKCAMNTHTHVLSYHKSPLLSFILSSRFKSCNLPFEWLKEMLQIRHLSENLQRCKQNNYVGFLFVCGLSHMFIIRA